MRTWFVWLLLLLGAAACKTAEPATEVRVVVDAYPELAALISRLDVRVLRPDAQGDSLASVSLPVDADGADPAKQLPLSFSVAPPGENPDAQVLVVVTARGRKEPGAALTDLAEQRAVVSFVANEARRLDLYFSRACQEKLCRDEPGQTCSEGGTCEAWPVHTNLPAARGTGLGGYAGAPVERGPPDASGSRDAGPDSSLTEGGAPDGGDPPDAGCDASDAQCAEPSPPTCEVAEDCEDPRCAEAPICAEGVCYQFACGEGETCRDVEGEATCGCREGYERCGEQCVNTQDDADHCGKCGYACAGELACEEGACEQPVHKLVVGGGLSCALMASEDDTHRVLCWGMLGDSTFSSLIPKEVENFEVVRDLALDPQGFRLCAIAPREDSVRCLGRCGIDCRPDITGEGNISYVDGEFGLLTRAGVRRVVTTTGNLYFPDGGVTCALDLAGDADCVGYPKFLATSDASKTRGLALSTRFQDIIALPGAMCGVTRAGEGLCWPGPKGQLSAYILDTEGNRLGGLSHVEGGCFASAEEVYCPDGEDIAHRLPLPDVIQVVGSRGYGCALDKWGQLHCWDGEANFEKPEKVEGLDDLLEFRSSAYDPGHTCVRRKSGEVACVGSNIFGQLGDGTTVLRTQPVPVRGLF